MPAALSAALAALLAADERAVLLVAGSGACTTDVGSIRAAHPLRVLHCGSGEQAAVLLAAGLAAEGYRPIVLLHGAHLTGRAAVLVHALSADAPPDVLVVFDGAVDGVFDGAGDQPQGVASPIVVSAVDAEGLAAAYRAGPGTGPRFVQIT